jgi:hypothetical protein
MAQRPEDRIKADRSRPLPAAGWLTGWTDASAGERATLAAVSAARGGDRDGREALTEEIDDHVDATRPIEPQHERTRTSTSPYSHQPPHRELSPEQFRLLAKRSLIRRAGTIGLRSHPRRQARRPLLPGRATSGLPEVTIQPEEIRQAYEGSPVSQATGSPSRVGLASARAVPSYGARASLPFRPDPDSRELAG